MSERPTLHVVGLPHTELAHDYLTCAYTMKCLKFAGMMEDEGFRVVTYSGPRNESRSSEHHVVVTEDERLGWFGEWNPFVPPNVDWDPAKPHWTTMNGRVVELLRERAGAHDVVCLIAGQAQKPIADALPHMLTCEWGVGYYGVFAPFCAFESQAWMHHVYGRLGYGDGRWYDTVIPNFFDPADFRAALEPKRDYLLYCGRVIVRKGVHVAAQIADRLGLPLVVAGPGVRGVGDDHADTAVVEAEDGSAIHGMKTRHLACEEMELDGADFVYVGPVDVPGRAWLMAAARAVLAPTTYVEPFGGVAVEAMMSGTPAVTTDWGAYTETVEEGLTGYRFRTLQEGVEATEWAMELDPAAVRERAHERFSLAAVGPQFTRWLDNLNGLWGAGWGA